MCIRDRLGTSGVQVSEMILGCWVMGGAQWGGADDNESIRAIHAAYDAGINTLDTAEAYNLSLIHIFPLKALHAEEEPTT